MAQSREAVPCLVEHQRSEVVLRPEAPDTVGSRLRASERPRTELALVPVDTPVQLDVRKAGLVDESEVEHRIAGLSRALAASRAG